MHAIVMKSRRYLDKDGICRINATYVVMNRTLNHSEYLTTGSFATLQDREKLGGLLEGLTKYFYFVAAQDINGFGRRLRQGGPGSAMGIRSS